MFYSFIIPLFNRPDEIRELLETLTTQTYKNFEVLVIEDGSKIKGDKEVEAFADRLDVKYFFKENEGQGFTRNYGFERAKGDYFIILDSDVLLPSHYLQSIEDFLAKNKVDAFGGPDGAHESFTPIQKAISYSMTSLFTTGGIRGRKKHLGKYHPRSFNMGISREVWEKTGGFKITRMGEDILFSIAIHKKGFSTALIPEAVVFHKRRTDFGKFFKQLKFFGMSRINVHMFVPEELKLIHWFPVVFLLYLVFSVLMTIVFPQARGLFMLPLSIWSLAILIDGTIQNKSLYIGFLGVYASYIQLIAYAVGLLSEFYKRKILGKGNDVTEYPY